MIHNGGKLKYEKAIDISCIQVEIKILLNSIFSLIARTWLDCKKRVYLASFGSLFSYLFKALIINVLSALKWQASQIKVDTVKNTSFEVLLPHRMD